MTAYQIYEEAIRPLPTGEQLTIARLIIDGIAPDAVDTPQSETGFDRLKQILPQIERVSFTDHDVAGVTLNDAHR